MKFKQQFAALTDNAVFLEDDSTEISNYLKAQNWLEPKEIVTGMEKPGEGNMNFVRRVRTNQRSFIIKQARPWVEKYPQIAAPLERIGVEMQFYKMVQPDAILNQYLPKLLYADHKNYVVGLEDLGESADFTYLYQKGSQLSASDLTSLIEFINHLHHQSFTKEVIQQYPKNQALKILNHEHIFKYPYLIENGFDLNHIQPGLQETSLRYKTDENLKKKIEALGEIYLGTGNVLLHGDYYPGSWLRARERVYVIDPEFSYFGRAEFDFGVFLAHLKMAQASTEVIQNVQNTYKFSDTFDKDLSRAFTGVEILRRIIGLAQLPLDLTLHEKQALLEEARSMIV